MALPISMFTKGVLITTPPLIYIFMGDIQMNSLVGDVNSASQESNMNSDDPNALPLDGSNTLSPTTENSLENKDLPSSDPVVDDVAKESDPGVSTGDSVVDSGDVKDNNLKVSEGVSENTNPGVAKEGAKEDGRSNVDDESTGGGDRVADGLPKVEDDEDNDDEEEELQADESKNKELNEKLKEAGIDDSCFLKDLKTVGKCTLTEEQMKKINFPQKDSTDDEGEIEITGLNEGEKITLTIESGYDENDFPKGGLRLTFHNPNSNEVKITGDGNDDAILKPNIDYDYMFSIDTDKWIDKAWSSLQKLGDKVGLNINDVLEGDSCTARNTQNKINVWKSRKEYVIGAESTSSEECLMKATENNKNHLEGFKLTVRDGNDITLTGGDGPSGGKTIDTLKKDAFYSFAPKRVEGKKVWFLIEKSQ